MDGLKKVWYGYEVVMDDYSLGQTVEAVCEANYESAVVVVVEATDSVNRGTLVVSWEKEEVVWKFDLVGQQQAYDLHTLFSSDHLVPGTGNPNPAETPEK